MDVEPTRTAAEMKITLDISDPLLREARKLATRERTTLCALVEQGLRRVVVEWQHTSSFTIRKASFKGRGLRAEMADASFEKLRNFANDARDS